MDGSYPTEFTPDVREQLTAPFKETEVLGRDGRGGMRFQYITARTAATRLDDVVGPGGWSTQYAVQDTLHGAVECQLTVLGVTKADIGYPNSQRDVQEQDDPTKSSEPLKASYSDAFKRAAVQFGVGRYLYADELRGQAQGQSSAPQGGGGYSNNSSGGYSRQAAPPANQGQGQRPPAAAPSGPPPKQNNSNPASEPQIRALFGVSMGEQGWRQEDVVRFVDYYYQCEPDQLDRMTMSKLIDYLKTNPRAVSLPPA